MILFWISRPSFSSRWFCPLKLLTHAPLAIIVMNDIIFGFHLEVLHHLGVFRILEHCNFPGFKYLLSESPSLTAGIRYDLLINIRPITLFVGDFLL